MKKIIKNLIILEMVVLLCVSSFASVISENDGTTFITKKEFEWLKNSFKEQIDIYNKSIDSKIDGAISSYLAGIKLSKEETKAFYDGSGSPILMCKSSKLNNLKRGYPGLNYLSLTASIGVKTNSANSMWSIAMQRDMQTDASKCFEMFRVKNGYLDYYTDNWNFSAALTLSSIIMTTPGAYSLPSSVNLRWHGNNSAKSSGPTKTEDADDADRTKYATKIGYRNYMLIWGAGLNLGSFFPDSGDVNTEYLTTGTVTNLSKSMFTSAITERLDFTKIYLVFDTSENDATSNIWFSSDLDAKNMNADIMTGYNNTNISFDLPSDNTIAPITTSGYIFLNGNNNKTNTNGKNEYIQIIIGLNKRDLQGKQVSTHGILG